MNPATAITTKTQSKPVVIMTLASRSGRSTGTSRAATRRCTGY